MTQPLVIVGAGGHALVLLDMLQELNRTILGFCDADPLRSGQACSGFPVLGNDETLLANYSPQQIDLVNGIGSIKDTALRGRIYTYYKVLGYRFETVIHPRAIVSRSAALAEGVQVMAGAIIQPGVVIGENSIINTGAVVDHDCVLGAHTHLAPGVTVSGGVNIGANVHVGTGATIIQGITIGQGAFVAAGAVVVADVMERETVMGLPARRVRS